MTVISFPTPSLQNPPIQPQFFQPSQFFISAITLGTNTTVTTTENMNFVLAQEVRLLIPPQFGCRQLNGALSYVVSIPASNQVVLNLDSSKNVDPFIAANSATQPQIVPVGDINNGTTNSSGRINQSTLIPGSFINISPL